MSDLVFTIAQNGYNVAFSKCIESQRIYADRIGAEYVCIKRPLRVPDAAQSAWLKIPVLLSALESGYERVAFIDSDCRVASHTPHFRDALAETASGIGMADGRTGRLNSGVILCDKSGEAIDFLRRVLDSVTEEIPEDDRRSLRFENGNVIYCDRVGGGVSRIPPVWNNTFDSLLSDYLRHYTGPLRAEYERGVLRSVVYRLLKATVFTPSLVPAQRDDTFRRDLIDLNEAVAGYYSKLRANTSQV